MTFKHIPFDESSTMRSFVKVAQDKGWIKSEPITKQAAKKTANLKPTSNLMENVIKLCDGLREKGFTKYADELETNLLTYKQAQTLYQVSNETGDDLLGEAHPKGSHKLEDVDSKEAIFEDLLDKHKQIVQVVEKKPSGKLASVSDILGAVKVVLGEYVNFESMTVEQLDSTIQSYLTAVVSDLEKIDEQTRGELSISIDSYVDDAKLVLENPQGSNGSPSWPDHPISAVSGDAIVGLKNRLIKLRKRLQPGWAHTGLSQNTWTVIQDVLQDAQDKVNLAITANSVRAKKQSQTFSGKEQPVGQTNTSAPVSDPFVDSGNLLIAKLQAFSTVSSVLKNPAAMAWIPKESKEVSDSLNCYNTAKASGQLDSVKTSLIDEMNSLQKEVADFANQAGIR